MDFASVIWWAYVLTVIAGLGFGAFQSILMKKAMLGKKTRNWLYFVKLLLWAAVLAALAFISLPLLIVFVGAASLTMIIGSMLIYRRAQREAR